MATEPIANLDTRNSDEAWWDAHDNSPEFAARVARADAQVAADLGFTGVTTEALARFCALDDGEARELLADRDALGHWLAAHA